MYGAQPFKLATDQQVGQAMSHPLMPGEQLAATDEQARRQQLRAASPAPTNTNPMGAQQIGQPPQLQPPQAGIPAAPQEQNPIQMAMGGIVPYDHATDGPKIRKYLEAEIDRRAKGGQIKHFDKGGKAKGIMAFNPLAPWAMLSPADPEEAARAEAEAREREALLAQIPTDIPPAARMLAAQEPPAGNTGDPYWDDPKARQNPATWLADRYVEGRKQQFNTPAAAPVGIAAAVPKISAADITKGVAEQEAALKNPTYFTKAAPAPKAAPRIGGAGSVAPSGGSAPSADDLAAFLKADAEGAAKPKSKAEAVKEYMDLFKSDGKQSAAMQAVLDKMEANRGTDPLTSGILGAMATIAGGGPNMLGRGLGGGIAGYQAQEALQRKDDHAIAAERLKMLQGDVAESNADKRAAVQLYGQDVAADRALKQSLAAQYVADAKERTGIYRADQQFAAAMARNGGGGDMDKKFLTLQKMAEDAASKAAAAAPASTKYNPAAMEALKKKARDGVLATGLLQLGIDPATLGLNFGAPAGAPAAGGKAFDPSKFSLN